MKTAGEAILSRRSAVLGAAGLLASCAPGLRPPIVVVDASGAPATSPQAATEPSASLQTGADVSGRVTVPVHINGAGPFEFVLDTGANRTVISAELAAKLALPDAGPAEVHGIAGVEPAPTVMVAQLEAASLTAKGLRLPALLQDRLGADGLLGVDVLRHRRVLIDFRAGRVTIGLTQQAEFEPSEFDVRRNSTGAREDLGLRVRVPARYRFGQLIIIAADVTGRTVTAFVDSGAETTVGNSALRSLVFEGARTDPKATRYIVPVLSATSQTATGELGSVPQLRVGGMSINGLTAVFADLHVFDIWGLSRQPSLMLGIDILRRFNAVELNYARREVAFYLPPGGRLG